MGRNKYIETPERMWELFKEYELHTKQNPIIVEDYVGKDAYKRRRQRIHGETV